MKKIEGAGAGCVIGKSRRNASDGPKIASQNGGGTPQISRFSPRIYVEAPFPRLPTRLRQEPRGP